jgi:hypothetical protein
VPAVPSQRQCVDLDEVVVPQLQNVALTPLGPDIPAFWRYNPNDDQLTYAQMLARHGAIAPTHTLVDLTRL